MVESGFISRLLAFSVAVATVLTSFVWIVDPYGVSPLGIDLRGFNHYKPRRVQIDRQLKPFEVWRKQPKSIFLGTSRIHQSIDPEYLAGTRFAPAYNASIPASTLAMNVANLEQFLVLDKNLKTVFVELYPFNFFVQAQDSKKHSLQDFLENSASLLIGNRAVWDSLSTIAYNIRINAPCYQISPGGDFVYPEGHSAEGPFRAFPQGITQIWDMFGQKIALSPGAVSSTEQIIHLAKNNDIELIFLLMPEHATFDYFIDYVDAWPITERWLREISAVATVYSFAQPNDWTEESPSRTMAFWYDPSHFTKRVGHLVVNSLATGSQTAGAPVDFMVRLTPEGVGPLIEARRHAVRQWAENNPEYSGAIAAALKSHGVPHGGAVHPTN